MRLPVFLPTGLVPQEDQGVFFAEVRAPEGCTLHETQEIVKKVEEKVKKIPELESYAVVSGYGMMAGLSGSCYATLIIRLKNWDDRPGISREALLLPPSGTGALRCLYRHPRTDGQW